MLPLVQRLFSRRKESPSRPPKIVGLVPARNEAPRIAFCLRALSACTDAIVYLDDCSDDSTVSAVEAVADECRVQKIIRKDRWYRDEPGDRNALLEAGRALGGTHFVVIDADEAFTANCATDNFLREKILSLRPGDQLAVHWIQLWRSVRQYRSDDSVWSGKQKRVAFCDDGRARYESDFIHTSRVPRFRSGKQHALDAETHGLLHFQFVHWPSLLLKQAWYRCLERVRDPKKTAQAINEKYAPSKDETNLRLKPVPAAWLAYEFFDESVFSAPDNWRRVQIQNWLREHGREFFADLDIWDIDWNDAAEKSPGASG